MSLSWDFFKEVFYTIGAVAGILAVFRPVLQHKYDLDNSRATAILEKFPERMLLELSTATWDARRIPTDLLIPFDELLDDIHQNLDSVRFSGPLSRYYSAEISALGDLYHEFRKYVQVPMWQPLKIDSFSISTYYWVFDKKSFLDEHGYQTDYAYHLACADELVEKMRERVRRIKLISEMHVLETPFSRILLPSRLRQSSLKKTKS